MTRTKDQRNGTNMLNSEESHACQVCGQAFRKVSGLKRHMRVHMSKQQAQMIDGLYTCQICTLNFQNSKDFERHVATEHSPQGQPQKCSQCGCFRPMTENSESKPFKCESCTMKINLQMNNHSMLVQQQQALQQQQLQIEQQQYQHQQLQFQIQHPPQQPSVPQPQMIHYPIPVHSQNMAQNTYNIDKSIIEIAGSDIIDIKYKVEKVEPTKVTTNKKMKDKACQSNPIIYNNMINTAVTERPKKPYTCAECNKGFSHSSTLAMHKKLHSGDYKYMCEYCDKTFFLNEYYTRHMRVHTKEKPYKCEVCGKAFSQSNTLTQHRRTHTGEKPYGCDQCGKMFSVRDYLNKHVRTHTGEKPYVCQTCGKKYSQASGLRAHQKQHSHFNNLITY